MFAIVLICFVGFLIFCLLNWDKPDQRKRFVWLLLLLPFAGSAQTQLNFDYYIFTSGKDSLYTEKATISIESDAVEVKTPFEFFSRYIVARGVDNAGDSILFFTGCDKLRICTDWNGIVKGAFLTHRGYTRYFGVDPVTYDRLNGWTNRTK